MHEENTKLIMINVLTKCKLSVYEILDLYQSLAHGFPQTKLATWC